MSKVALILEVTNPSCFNRSDIVKLLNKLSNKYGFSMVKIKGKYILTPNLVQLLFVDGVKSKYSALFKYVSLLRFLIRNGCVRIVRVVSDFEYNTIVNSFVRFLNEGVDSNGTLWYVVKPSIFEGMDVHRLIINNRYCKDVNTFDSMWFKSNFRETMKMISVGKKCCFVIKPVDNVDFFIKGHEHKMNDLHVVTLLKLAGLNLLRHGEKRVDYLREYSIHHPINVLIHNVNKHMLGVDYDNDYKVDVQLNNNQYLNSNDGLKSTIIVDSTKFSNLCNCLNSYNCDFVNWDTIKSVHSVLSSLVLIEDVKEELTSTRNRVVYFDDINSTIIKKLLYPDVFELFRTAVKVVCDKFKYSPVWNNRASVVFHYKFFRGVKELYFAGLEFKLGGSAEYLFEVFNLTPVTKLLRSGVYYDGEKFVKLDSYTHVSKSIIEHKGIEQSNKNVSIVFV